MPDANSRGPAVGGDEDLFRMITTKSWWVSEQGRPSSAAFDKPIFSVNVVSMSTLQETIRQLHDVLGRPEGGVAQFNAGFARENEFDARLERDDQFPDNDAHAHVYCDAGRSSRKTKARRLADSCTVPHPPTF